jgi:hypothetical protein
MRSARGADDICLAMTSMTLMMLWYSARSVRSWVVIRVAMEVNVHEEVLTGCWQARYS